jgi:FAD synthase
MLDIRAFTRAEGEEHDGELHLLDVHEKLHPGPITLHFVERLHGERQLPDAEALDAQVRHDLARAKEILTPCRPTSK